MSTTTENYGLVMPALTDSPPDVTVMNPNWQIIDSELKKHDDEINAAESIIKNITDGTKITPSVNIGMNSVIRKSDGVTSIPKFTIQGKSYVNLLGKDGNCEDVSKWYSYQATLALDSAKKVYGANAIEITLTASAGNMNKSLSSYNFDPSKYYLFSAYVDKGDADIIAIAKDITGGGTDRYVDFVDTTPTRVGFTTQPTDNNENNILVVTVVGSSGESAYIDGIMINEITATEYSTLSVDQLLDKYPYVDSYACLQNPYIEVRHDNLVRNGNGEEGISWWSIDVGSPTFKYSDGYFVITDSDESNWAIMKSEKINAKPNTSYSYYFIGKAGTQPIKIGITEYDKYGTQLIITEPAITNTTDTVAFGNITTQEGTTYIIIRPTPHNNSPSDTGTAYFKEMMLVEGTTAPTEYKSCRIERCVIEGKFTFDDSFTLENGKVSGLLNWKHKTLYGKDYDWQYWNDQVGFKQIALPLNQGQSTIRTMTKYNRKPLKQDGLVTTADSENTGIDYTWVGVSDTDTGWTEFIAPNADEVKAFMNGWKALGNDGSRYTVFGNIIFSDFHVNSNAFPSNTATILTTATSNTNTITVANASIFKIGDPISVFGNGGTTVSNISGNTITVSSNQSVQPSGYTVFKIDVTGSSTQLINYCKNNVAPNYEGYQLHYKLANPEPITDENAHLVGDIPKLDKGDNYLYVDSGMVLGELANVKMDVSYAYVNQLDSVAPKGSQLKYKTERLFAIYKNMIENAADWVLEQISTYAFGNARAYMSLSSNKYDTNATYTVDYQILKTLHTSPTAITMQYQQDVLSAVKDLAEGLNSRQKADSALDALIDLSLYEEITLKDTILCGVTQLGSTALYIQGYFDMTPKKCVPVVTFSNVVIKSYSGTSMIDVTGKFTVQSVIAENGRISIKFVTADTTTIANVSAYGACIVGGMLVVADCRGRL